MNKKKLTYNSLALSSLKNRKKSYALMIIGIVLAMMFSSGVPFFISCMNSSQNEIQYRKQGKQETIVIDAQNYDFDIPTEQGAIDGDIGFAHVLSYVWNEREDFSDGTMIGWLDDRATELYYPIVSEGRMPKEQNEIAIEKSALQRMRVDTKLGEKITLKALICDSDEFLEEETDVTYTLVGILSDKKSNIEHFYDEAITKANKIPAAFVTKDTQIEIGGKEALVAFFNENRKEDGYLYTDIPYTNVIDTSFVYSFSSIDSYSAIANNVGTVTFLSVLLAFMSCFGIVNAFNSNLKERKKQIGMLKAVGATRKQLITIFGREAFIICLLTAPLSVALSYGAVRAYANIMGDSFIFEPDFLVLIAGVFLGIICVMLSSLIPLFNISRLSPLQAIRNIEMMRKIKNKKIKTQTSFSVERHLAKRKLLFSKGKNIAISVIIACCVIISCLSLSFLNSVLENATTYYDIDYEINDYGGVGSSNSFINDLSYQNTESPLTENKKQEVLEIPQVKDIYEEKQAKLNIVFKGEVPEYLQINEYASFTTTSSRFLTAEFSDALSASGQGNNNSDYSKMMNDNLKAYMQAAPNPDYIHTKKVAGFEKEELFNVEVTAQNPELFVFDGITKDDIIAGEINIDKLNSGEEILIYAPEKIGFSYEAIPGGGITYGLYNLAPEADVDSTADMVLRDNIKAEADSPFKVGDTLTLTLLCDDGKGNITREDKKVKIGAILGKNSSSGVFRIFTTLEGLDTFKTNFNYSVFDVELKEDCSAELDEIMQAELSSIFPGKDITSVFEFFESEKQQRKMMIISIASLVFVFLCVSISLINNSISAQIRDGKRTLGTLRAVGASEKELVSSYIIQIANIMLLGFGAGSIIYICSYRFIGLIAFGDYVPIAIWPVLLIFIILSTACYINLKLKIKMITNNSIVENIREL